MLVAGTATAFVSNNRTNQQINNIAAEAAETERVQVEEEAQTPSQQVICGNGFRPNGNGGCEKIPVKDHTKQTQLQLQPQQINH